MANRSKPSGEADDGRLPCGKGCGRSILPATAKRTGGLCMPCYKELLDKPVSSPTRDAVRAGPTPGPRRAMADARSIRATRLAFAVYLSGGVLVLLLTEAGSGWRWLYGLLGFLCVKLIDVCMRRARGNAVRLPEPSEAEAAETALRCDNGPRLRDLLERLSCDSPLLKVATEHPEAGGRALAQAAFDEKLGALAEKDKVVLRFLLSMALTPEPGAGEKGWSVDVCSADSLSLQKARRLSLHLNPRDSLAEFLGDLRVGEQECPQFLQVRPDDPPWMSSLGRIERASPYTYRYVTRILSYEQI